MIYPVNQIAIIQHKNGKKLTPYHNGKALDFGWGKYHHQDILAVDDGVIYRLEIQPNGGKVIYLKHNTGMISAYGHLDSFSVKKGQKVKRGQKIGKMGKTGKGVTGEHLHFEIHSKGTNIYGKSDIDPMKFLQVYPSQEVLDTSTNKKYKNDFLYAPENQSFTAPATYRLLVKKAVRKSPYLLKNIVSYCEVGKDVKVSNIINKNKRNWGKISKGYLVLENNDGTDQAFKL